MSKSAFPPVSNPPSLLPRENRHVPLGASLLPRDYRHVLLGASLLPRENRYGPVAPSPLPRKNRVVDHLVPSSRYAGPPRPRCCLGKTHLWALRVLCRTACRPCRVVVASLLPRENAHAGYSVTLVARSPVPWVTCGITCRVSGVLAASLLPKENRHVAPSSLSRCHAV